jgi:hypothetical protein
MFICALSITNEHRYATIGMVETGTRLTSGRRFSDEGNAASHG